MHEVLVRDGKVLRMEIYLRGILSRILWALQKFNEIPDETNCILLFPEVQILGIKFQLRFLSNHNYTYFF